MFSPNPFSLFDDFLCSPKIYDCTEDNSSILSNSGIISSKPSLSEIFQIDNNDFIAYLKTDQTNKREKKEKQIFIIKLINNKRGRKANNGTKMKVHTSLALDNIHSKIQTHFLNFVVLLSNDAIKTILHLDKNFFFKKFDRAKKLKISSKYFNKLKNSSIKDLLMNMGISEKYKRSDKDFNKENLGKLMEYNWFKKFFEIKYLDLFFYYYNDGQPLRQLSFNGQIIILSEKTKSFFYLLQKYEDSREDIIRVAKIFYFNENNNIFSK